MDSKIERTLAYHERTKHHYYRYARAPGYMDWDTQPHPFRFYEGTKSLKLPHIKKDESTPYIQLYERHCNLVREFSLEHISVFLELSMGLSAWKSIPDHKWALRINPSSGNLHPTEAHLILPDMKEEPAGVFHYDPFHHALEKRAEHPQIMWAEIERYFETKGFFIALSSIYWREAWKYGERAFRYCHHDVGHALAALNFSANLQGWKVTYLNALSDEELKAILGFNTVTWKNHEEEYPDLLCFVHSREKSKIPLSFPSKIISCFSDIKFQGMPNSLSSDHVDWDVITDVFKATIKPKTEEKKYEMNETSYLCKELPLSAEQIIRQRRSAVAFDGKTVITKSQFLAMLDKTLPRQQCVPFDVGLSDICVHLLLFVHRVEGVEQGLYFLVRDEKDLNQLKEKFHSQHQWEKINEPLPLYLLKKGDFRNTAASVSCGQDIGGDSSFSLGMIARFDEEIKKAPHNYRTLFWETGMIGQVLYLEAEAHGVRGTGIGCFFDDPVHEILGLNDNSYQSLYHFTIGGAVEDIRLMTHPPYHHLEAIS
ncbi:MAG: SagB/ThcOx family dehydrogenase [Deltaproteobacteria bacterium]|nr:SagB/ThcOx family dehydrogenase [Deltaproteobacteria bacterium]